MKQLDDTMERMIARFVTHGAPIKKAIDDTFEDMLRSSSLFKHAVVHIGTLARETIRISENVTNLIHTVNGLARHVEAHAQAIQQLYALNQTIAKSMKDRSVELTLPSGSKPDDAGRKPN